ncbi:MAG: class I SAM-dependent methyltransferase [Candidatus Nanopelagicales bacterium]
MPVSDDPAIAEFFNAWTLYRAVIEADAMEHREIRRVLRPILAERAESFSILDLGCGDSALLAPILPGLPLARYLGVDVAGQALEYARLELTQVADVVELREADLLEPLAGDETFDVIVLSFVLHHFDSAGKRQVLARARESLNPRGDLILIDVVRQDGQSRADYLDAYDSYVRTWQVGPGVPDRIIAHVRRNDWPEEMSTLPGWGPAAGFRSVELLYSGGQGTQAAWRMRA